LRNRESGASGGGQNRAEQHPIPIHPSRSPSPPRAIQNKLLIAISESRKSRRNSVHYPVNAGSKKCQMFLLANIVVQVLRAAFNMNGSITPKVVLTRSLKLKNTVMKQSMKFVVSLHYNRKILIPW